MTKTTISSGILPAEFEHEMFGQLRVVVSDNQKTMFNLSDVCRALDINNSRQVKSRLAEGGVITADTPTRNQFGTMVMQPMTYIDEANLYRCIFQSRKAEAEKFQAWVFEEVLPQIRQTGGYIPLKDIRTREVLTEDQVVEKAFGILQKTISHENLPADGCFTTTEIAKEYGMDVKDFYSWLVDAGIVKYVAGRYVMTPAYESLGFDAERIHHCFSLNGRPKVKPYLVWTPRGRNFINTMLNN